MFTGTSMGLLLTLSWNGVSIFGYIVILLKIRAMFPSTYSKPLIKSFIGLTDEKQITTQMEATFWVSNFFNSTNWTLQCKEVETQKEE